MSKNLCTGLVLAMTVAGGSAATAGSVDPLEMMSTFGLISLGDLTMASHAAAPVYAGGNVTGSQSINPGTGTVGDISATLVVGGDLAGTPTLNNSTVVAGTISGGVNGGGNTVTTGASVPVADVADAFTALSASLASLGDTPGAVFGLKPGTTNNYVLHSGAGVDGFAVLNFADTAFLSLGSLAEFSNTAGTFIVNIGGTTANISSPYNQDDSTVIFNFYEATEVNVTATFGFGLLAPGAEVNLLAGGTDTFVVGGEVFQQTEVRGTFTGDLPPDVVPLPAGIWLTLSGLAGLAALRRRAA